MKKFIFTGILGLGLVTGACGSADNQDSNRSGDADSKLIGETSDAQLTGTIPEVAAAAGNFNTLLAAVEAAGLGETLSSDGPFTVFAPTDEAFAALPEGALEALLADPEALKQVLLYHVVAGAAVDAATAVTLDSATMANEQQVRISLDGESLFINDSMVIAADVGASNGIIHVIDAVLLPSVDDSREPGESESVGTIPEVAAAAGSFNTLLAAVEAAGLGEVLSSDGPFTVFAPTDEAFAALPEGALDELLADPEALKQVLLYHVIAGAAVDAATAVTLDSATMANEQDVSINLEGDALFINESQVIATDVNASNGIIHVIDAVLLPSSH